MAFAIPKIEYKNLETQGNTTNLNATISGIPDTTFIEVGMFVKGSGIPAGAIVFSKTSNSVTLVSPKVCSATALAVVINFGFDLNFVYPPIEKKGEKLTSNAHTAESLSGIRQISVDYIEGTRKLSFSFLSQTLFTSLLTFLNSWALLGKTFRYFEDQTLTTYVEVELDKLAIADPTKIAPKGVDQYVWEQTLEFRRVIL